MCSSDLSDWPWVERPQSLLTRFTYKRFRYHLTRLFGSRPNIGTHSMRRGGVTEKIAQGIEPRLVQFLGRWRTSEAFEGYIGPSANIERVAEAMGAARRAEARGRSSEADPARTRDRARRGAPPAQARRR